MTDRQDTSARENVTARAGRWLSHVVKPLRTSLSSQLLILTIIFVMIAEVLIFVPSISNFRDQWLRQRAARAQIATLALEATPDNMLSDELRDELLVNAEAFAVVLHRDAARRLILRDDMPPAIDATYDLRMTNIADMLYDSMATLMAPDGRIIRVISEPRFEGGDFIEVVIDETPLRHAMFTYSINILSLSIFISVLTAGLVFLTLNRFLVRPMRRITENMVAFSAKPEDASRIIDSSGRLDEIGVAERELADLQSHVRNTLNQQSRLAALGTAVSKVNHDLRNILANVQLISDRLGGIDDPTVQSLAPRLFASLDRAIDLCTKTLKFGTANEAPPVREIRPLHIIAQDVADTLRLDEASPVRIVVEIDVDLKVDADPDHLFRILMNLGRNAMQALGDAAGTLTFSARRQGTDLVIDIADTGPGMPDAAKAHLFEAFAGSTRAGGSGLGLAIAAELASAHGGTLRLLRTGAEGTTFRLVIPDRGVSARAAQ